MFAFKKKQPEQPVVINFTVQPFAEDAAINLIVTDSHLSDEMREALLKKWKEKFNNKKLIVMCKGATLEQMSDADLRAVGLIRADFGDKDEQSLP
ncbi:DUF1127 domain-containing protein [Acinetobacter sp. 187]|uniref:DUF1127 domain-containing protein n=1 Tax=Acinetobacter lanii TaxID=2715163 RepID=UPI00140849BB|nr:DUF1127 domain-containing protein [Acinetobacter lanii]NHC02341.1 DUF1127 domain-containing protein [Acinetobacter lanii]